MSFKTSIDLIAQQKGCRSPFGRLVFGYVLVLPSDTDMQIKTIAAKQTDLVFHDEVSARVTSSPMSAFDLVLAATAPGDVVLVERISQLIGPLASAFTDSLALEGLELVFIDEHYEAGRGK